MVAAPLSGRRAGLVTLVLALLSIFPPLATDMYLSAMGALAESLEASESAVEMSLSLFFLGLCVGQLLIGPLLDRFGRKGPLLAGTLLFVTTSIGLLLVHDVVVFNTLRFFQAVGACAGMVVGRAIVSDLYEGRRAAQVLTILVMLMTLGPILAPFLGSLLLSGLGWRSIFITMVGVGVVALALSWVVIPETYPPEKRRPGALTGALRHFGVLAVRPAFILPALVAGLVQAAMFAFITGSSGVFQDSFGLSSLAYGLLFGFIAAALVVFGKVNELLLNRYSAEAIMTIGLPIYVVASGALLLVSGTTQLWLLVIPMWLSIGLVGLLSANAMSIAMEGAGIGSAAIGGIQFGLAFATSSAVAMSEAEGAGPMATAIFVTALAGAGLWSLQRRWFAPRRSAESGLRGDAA